MKIAGIALASLGLASAATVQKRASYDNWKVYRVNVGDKSAKLSELVDSLQLETWKGKASSSKVVDVMVPPTSVDKFEESDLDVELMHENLGLSIADEESFTVYAGIHPTTISMQTRR